MPSVELIKALFNSYFQDSDQFFDSLDAFVEHSFQLIEKYRYTFNYLNPEECVELGKLLL